MSVLRKTTRKYFTFSNLAFGPAPDRHRLQQGRGASEVLPVSDEEEGGQWLGLGVVNLAAVAAVFAAVLNPCLI